MNGRTKNALAILIATGALAAAWYVDHRPAPAETPAPAPAPATLTIEAELVPQAPKPPAPGPKPPQAPRTTREPLPSEPAAEPVSDPYTLESGDGWNHYEPPAAGDCADGNCGTGRGRLFPNLRPFRRR